MHQAYAKLLNKMLKGEMCEKATELICESKMCWVDRKSIPISITIGLLKIIGIDFSV